MNNYFCQEKSIKPPSIPSNCETVKEVTLIPSHLFLLHFFKDMGVFNQKGFYANLQHTLNNTKVCIYLLTRTLY